MSPNVFLAPCDAATLAASVASPVDLSAHDEAPADLGDGEVRIAGVGDGSRNETNFEKMEAGDLVLLYGDGEYVGTGWVGTTVEDADGWASETLWDDSEATRLFTVDDFTPVSVSRAAVNSIFGYSESYTPGSLLRVADGKISNQPRAIKLAVERYSERDD